MITNLIIATPESLLALVNNERSKNGFNPLKLDSRLVTCGQLHSEYQAKSRTMTHSDPAGDLGSRIKNSGFNWISAGENVASGQPTEQSVMEAWMNSSGHRANILNPKFTHFGSAVIQKYWTQVFAAVSNNGRFQGNINDGIPNNNGSDDLKAFGGGGGGGGGGGRNGRNGRGGNINNIHSSDGSKAFGGSDGDGGGGGGGGGGNHPKAFDNGNNNNNNHDFDDPKAFDDGNNNNNSHGQGLNMGSKHGPNLGFKSGSNSLKGGLGGFNRFSGFKNSMRKRKLLY
ncbi:hypothetical protein G9A89_004684 [Geosiphon pyriformis]|nr:hypothetical protein G9A89_004684 [Geosiphon pyriformis]